MSRHALAHLAHLALACGLTLPLGAVPLGAQLATIISTEDGGADRGRTFPLPAITTGQTFMTPNARDVMLVGFEMAAGVPGVAATPATARVAVWDAANGRMGPVLWSATTTLGPSAVYQFRSVGQTLAAGTPYVFALSVALNGNVFEWLFQPYDAYPGGVWVEIQAADLATLQGTRWTAMPAGDLAFTLVFRQATVPEPTTWTLTAAGLLVIAGYARPRQRRLRSTAPRT